MRVGLELGLWFRARVRVRVRVTVGLKAQRSMRTSLHALVPTAVTEAIVASPVLSDTSPGCRVGAGAGVRVEG
jgi:hypothetical protein